MAAGNKHSLAVLEGGTVFSWGSNSEGQLGYGTSDSASNALPRLVEAMKVGSVSDSTGLPIHLYACAGANFPRVVTEFLIYYTINQLGDNVMVTDSRVVYHIVSAGERMGSI